MRNCIITMETAGHTARRLAKWQEKKRMKERSGGRRTGNMGLLKTCVWMKTQIGLRGRILSTPNCVMGAWNTKLAFSHVASLEFTISPWHHQSYPLISAEHNSNINHCTQAGSWWVAGLFGRVCSAFHLNGDLGRPKARTWQREIGQIFFILTVL